MAWPAGAISTANVDATTDDPELAVVQLKAAIDQLNQVIAHVSAFAQGLLDDADAATARATLAALSSADLAPYAPLSSPALTGSPTAPTPAAGNSSTAIATSAFVQGELAAKAPLNSPTFTGTPAAPTRSVDDSTTGLATTAFVTNQAGASTPLADSGAGTVGTSKRYARDDHRHPYPSLAPAFQDSPITISSPMAATATHNLGRKPYLWQATIRCVTDELGYVAGDEIDVSVNFNPSNVAGYGVWVSTTVIGVVVNSGFLVVRKDTQIISAITNANWEMILRCW
jgi:hypothetical protein